MRISQKDLEARIKYLNKLTGNPEVYGERVDGKLIIHVGHYHLNCAYGGYELVQTCNAGGGVIDVLHTGHVSKKELYAYLNAYIRGVEYSKNK